MDISNKDFQADIGFVRDAKALSDEERAQYEAQLGEGDLLISGIGANFDIDRQNEAFSSTEPIAKGLADFVNGDAALAFHHKHDTILGKVFKADLLPGKGVEVVARVDYQPESSPHRHLYEQIKKGSLNALSFGGFFKRAMTPNGPRIVGADFTELSVTGVPVGRGTNFQVIAGKALEDLQAPPEPDAKSVEDAERLAELEAVAAKLGAIFEVVMPSKATSD